MLQRLYCYYSFLSCQKKVCSSLYNNSAILQGHLIMGPLSLIDPREISVPLAGAPFSPRSSLPLLFTGLFLMFSLSPLCLHGIFPFPKYILPEPQRALLMSPIIGLMKMLELTMSSTGHPQSLLRAPQCHDTNCPAHYIYFAILSKKMQVEENSVE